MTIIKCPECSKKISDIADACPSCGVPIKSKSESQGSGTTLTTTQLTSKKLKLHMLFFNLLIITGIIMLVVVLQPPRNDDTDINTLISISLMMLGFIGVVITKVRTWWHHG